MKICSKCNVEKNLTEFKRYSVCVECTKINNKIYNDNRKKKMQDYYLENKDIIMNRSKNNYIKNKDNILIKTKIYASKNKEKRNEQLRKRLKEDKLFKLTCNIRTLISMSIKNNGYKKKSKTYEILGISFFDFKIYIERQFKEGMSWENYGEWHLDHKIPISWCENEENIYELNNYTNFQPLWAAENYSKGNRYSH